MTSATNSYEGAFEAFLAEYQGNGSRLDRLETLVAKRAWDAAIEFSRQCGPKNATAALRHVPGFSRRSCWRRCRARRRWRMGEVG